MTTPQYTTPENRSYSLRQRFFEVLQRFCSLSYDKNVVVIQIKDQGW
jgi:hypothetical protein